MSVSNSVSLVLATLGAASDDGAWIALVGFPLISAEVAAGFGIDLRRLALVPDPGTQWTVAVGALLDAMDIVAARPPARALPAGDVRRLAARARKQQSVLVPYLSGASATTGWPGADVRLLAGDSSWHGAQDGHGRLRARRLIVQAEGRGTAARPRRADLWLPGESGLALAGSRTSGLGIGHPTGFEAGYETGYETGFERYEAGGSPAVVVPSAPRSRSCPPHRPQSQAQSQSPARSPSPGPSPHRPPRPTQARTDRPG